MTCEGMERKGSEGATDRLAFPGPKKLSCHRNTGLGLNLTPIPLGFEHGITIP